MDGFSPAGVGDTAGGRPIILRDSSRIDKGDEVGNNAGLVSIITGSKEDGTVTGIRDGVLQPRNWHESISKKPLGNGRSLKDRRYSVALIADAQNGFDGFAADDTGGGGTQDAGSSSTGKNGGAAAAAAAASAAGSSSVLFSGGEASLLDSGGHFDAKGNFIESTQVQAASSLGGNSFGGIGEGFALGGGASGSSNPGDVSGRANKVPDKALNPIIDDWGPDQKSTRIVDYRDKKGRAALFVQLARVIDDANKQYTAAIPFRRLSPSEKSSADKIATGYLYDAKKKQSGFLDSVFAVNSKDSTGKGREGTPYGLLGIRTDAHYEWVPSSSGTTDNGKGEATDIDESNHGPAKFDGAVNISSYADASDSASGTGYKGALYLDKSATPNQWRPCFKIPASSSGGPLGFNPFHGNINVSGSPVGVYFGATRVVSGGGGQNFINCDILADTLTIAGGQQLMFNAGGGLSTSRGRIFCKNLVGTGSIIADGGNGGYSGAGTGGYQGGPASSVGRNSAGGHGSATIAPNPGSPMWTDGTIKPYCNGGAGGSAAGSTFGGAQTPPTFNPGPFLFTAIPYALGWDWAQTLYFNAGVGGASGEQGTSGIGGSGGGGGGLLVIVCEDMSGFTGTISAKGGNGEPATAGFGGGGGGGGGGGVIVIISPKAWAGTPNVSGGTGGLGANVGGQNGSSGNDGLYIAITS